MTHEKQREIQQAVEAGVTAALLKFFYPRRDLPVLSYRVQADATPPLPEVPPKGSSV